MLGSSLPKNAIFLDPGSRFLLVVQLLFFMTSIYTLFDPFVHSVIVCGSLKLNWLFHKMLLWVLLSTFR